MLLVSFMVVLIVILFTENDVAVGRLIVTLGYMLSMVKFNTIDELTPALVKLYAKIVILWLPSASAVLVLEKEVIPVAFVDLYIVPFASNSQVMLEDSFVIPLIVMGDV
ncbi:hypothetical protein DRQ25_00390 [Candidatus Fermentibacteria bacterium]|nr:MAG: hypothetical protein DRQ25_00390 [Candidatus Fermentibacteria bacterium]